MDILLELIGLSKVSKEYQDHLVKQKLMELSFLCSKWEVDRSIALNSFILVRATFMSESIRQYILLLPLI